MKKKAGKIYKTCGNIQQVNDRYCVGIICPKCNYFLMLYSIKGHVQRLKLPAFHCSNCSRILRITFEYNLPKFKIYRQSTEVERSNLRYKFPTPAERFLRGS